jgi:hypothetical protein
MHDHIRTEKWYVRWYNYNKYSIPVILTIIGSIIFTVFLDFRTGDIDFKSHISAINLLTNKIVAFYLFSIYMIALVQVANSMAFSKKRSPISLILFTLLNMIQVLLVVLYVYIFYREVEIRTDGFMLPSYALFSMNVMITGAVFYILSTIFAWFYVDWKYVKIED